MKTWAIVAIVILVLLAAVPVFWLWTEYRAMTRLAEGGVGGEVSALRDEVASLRAEVDEDRAAKIVRGVVWVVVIGAAVWVFTLIFREWARGRAAQERKRISREKFKQESMRIIEEDYGRRPVWGTVGRPARRPGALRLLVGRFSLEPRDASLVFPPSRTLYAVCQDDNLENIELFGPGKTYREVLQFLWDRELQGITPQPRSQEFTFSKEQEREIEEAARPALEAALGLNTEEDAR